MKNNKLLLICALALGLPSVVSNVMHNETPMVAKAEGVSKTIKFGTADGSIDISSSSIKQSIDNIDWNFTTTGTTSFTKNSSYSQIGSSSKPASKISIASSYFTNMTLSSFEIKLGGFSGTAGNVTCKYAGVDICSGKLNANKDVTISNKSVSITESNKSKGFEIQIDSISKGVRLYSITYSFAESSTPTITYSVDFKLNDGTDTTFETKTVIENESVVLPEDNPTRDGYKFTGWYTNSEATEKFDETTKITSDLILYAGWEETNYTKDELTADNFTATSTAYTEFDNVKINDAIYTGNSASTNSTIQLRDKSNSGIVSTTSGGKIRKFSLAWNSKTQDRTLEIYASNEKYTSASDLYDSSKCGTLVGKLSKAKSETTLEISTDYKYVGIKASDGALYLDSIIFEWEKEKPTIDETILKSSYLFTEMMDKDTNITNGIRFVGSVKEEKFSEISSLGFSFTLTSTDKNVTKEYGVESTKLYNIIDDSDSFAFGETGTEVFQLEGYLSYSLILNNITETFNGSISFYTYAVIEDVTYNSNVTTINIINGVESK